MEIKDSKAKQIGEAMAVYQDGDYKFADFDVQGLFEIKPRRFHFIEEDEVQAVREFLKLDEVETEEELRAIRNTIVRYVADGAEEKRKQSDELAKKWHEENPEGDFGDFMKQNPYDIMWDQMSAFTHVIDMELMKRFGHT